MLTALACSTSCTTGWATATCRGWCGNHPSTCCPNSAIAIGSRQPQLYWLAPWAYDKQVQRPIKVGQSGAYRFDLALPKSPLAPTARLRVICRQPLSDVRLAASVNGHPLDLTRDLAPPLGYAYDAMLGPMEHAGRGCARAACFTTA